MNLTPEEKEIGRNNYFQAVDFTRRDFLQGALASGALTAGGLGAMYFGYSKVDNPVRIGVIGTGDEGNILIGALNPDYVEVVAIADIRPSSIHRAFHGDWGGGNPSYTHSLRPGLMQKYGWQTENEARHNVKVYERWEDLIENSDVEGVIIALPLHLHAKVAVQAMMAGKHVLTEKLMAHNVAQCKVMSRVAAEKNKYLATGHQRHYSVLYDNAVNLIQWGLLGEIHHIRAQWHRGNLPGKDSWAVPIPGGEIAQMDDPRGKYKKGDLVDTIQSQLDSFKRKAKEAKDPSKAALYNLQAKQWAAWVADKNIPADAFGYEDRMLDRGRNRTALEELVRWRLWDRTGGGLMAELGSHQLDASSIFVSALRKDGGKAHPLTVHAVGGRHIFPYNRDADDHVYCTYEFPGPGYDKNFDPGYSNPLAGVPDPNEGIPDYTRDENKKIVVTYSSINGNGYGGYGEVVMGTKGTLILEKEQEVMVYKGSSTSTKVGVKGDEDGAVLDTQASGDGPVAKAVENSGPVSRGYKEEIEHWAWCIRNQAPENRPRCHPEVAVADAVIALTSKVAIANGNAGKSGYIEFEESWFDIDKDDTPDGSTIAAETESLTKKA